MSEVPLYSAAGNFFRVGVVKSPLTSEFVIFFRVCGEDPPSDAPGREVFRLRPFHALS